MKPTRPAAACSFFSLITLVIPCVYGHVLKPPQDVRRWSEQQLHSRSMGAFKASCMQAPAKQYLLL